MCVRVSAHGAFPPVGGVRPGGGAAISTASSRALRFPPVTRTVSATYFQCDRREVVMK